MGPPSRQNRTSATLSVSPATKSGDAGDIPGGDTMGGRADFAAAPARGRTDAGLSWGALAARTHPHRGSLSNTEPGPRWPSQSVALALDTALNPNGALTATWRAADATTKPA